MPRSLAERTDYTETGTGMEIELVWSEDETMVKLTITGSGNTKTAKTVHMSSLELDELRSFLTSKIG
jgi:hypothetical protein